MRQIRLRSRAEIDLVDIWAYTFAQWDEGQADKYVDELQVAINHLVDHPQRGVPRSNVRDGFRVLFVNRHAVYYQLTPATVDIVRVLHAQMDPDGHL